MSTGRNRELDRAATRGVLLGLREVDNGELNWLDHEVTSAAARIDSMLLTGATADQMTAARNTYANHLKHLRGEHGLPIVEAGGVWVFDRNALGASGNGGAV